MTSTTLNWGILAPGGIAAKFAADLALMPGQRLAAVGSRTEERSRAFAQTWGDADTRAHTSYDDLLADPEVDVVYVASPHALHLEQATTAITAGKHVLCEKPLTLDRGTAEALIAVARTHDRFLMEAMWSACNPAWRDLATRLAAGDFGTPRHLAADFSFHADVDPTHRLLNPALGGGALLDIGIYPLTFAHLMLGEAEALSAVGTVTDDGVDLDVAIAGRYPGGTLATLTTGLTSHSPNGALITTDQGWISLAGDFHAADHYVFHPMAERGTPGEPVRFDPPVPLIGVGYGNEAVEVGRCLQEGLRESPLVPHAQTLAILGQVDSVRAALRG